MLYSTIDAARYLKLSESTIKYHVHKSKQLTPEKIGKTLVFTQAQLDNFNIARRKVGRPSKKEK